MERNVMFIDLFVLNIDVSPDDSLPINKNYI